VDRNGRTALSWAAEKGFVRIVKMLLQKKVNLENSKPLEYATMNEDTTIMRMLLKAGA